MIYIYIWNVWIPFQYCSWPQAWGRSRRRRLCRRLSLSPVAFSPLHSHQSRHLPSFPSCSNRKKKETINLTTHRKVAVSMIVRIKSNFYTFEFFEEFIIYHGIKALFEFLYRPRACVGKWKVRGRVLHVPVAAMLNERIIKKVRRRKRRRRNTLFSRNMIMSL